MGEFGYNFEGSQGVGCLSLELERTATEENVWEERLPKRDSHSVAGRAACGANVAYRGVGKGGRMGPPGHPGRKRA